MRKSVIALTLSVVTALVTVCGMTIGVAQAATSSPRLQGKWVVKLIITSDQDNQSMVGTIYNDPFDFTPSCAGPAGCETKLVRTRDSGHPATATTMLEPSGDTYSGKTVYYSGCFLNNGDVINDAYKTTETTETTRIIASATDGGNYANYFKGTLALVLVPTAAGQKHDCAADRITAKIRAD